MAQENNGNSQLTSVLSSWSGPRTLIIPKTEQGYGFTLRHFIVYPPESAIQDQFKEEDLTDHERHRNEEFKYRRTKLKSLDPMDTIFVKSVKEDSPAHHIGLNTGDRILSVNGVPVTGRSYEQVIALIQSSDGNLILEVLPQDEDILQMAYRNTNYHGYQRNSNLYHPSSSNSINNVGGASVVRVKGVPRFSSQSSVDSILSTDITSRENRMSTASSMDELSDTEERKTRLAQDRTKKMKTSTSYTSGMSIYPKNNSGDLSFVDRKREFENRSKENSQKTYSFGLFYPTSSKEKQSEGMSSSSVIYRQSKDNILQPNDSQENISRSYRSTTRVIPLEQRQQSDHHPPDKLSRASARHSSTSPSRHSYPDYSSANQSSVNQRSYASPQNTASERQKSSPYSTTRHYVPVLSQSSVTQSPISKGSKISASADNLEDRLTQLQAEFNYRSHYNTRVNQNQSDGQRTFIVKIGDKNYENGVSPRRNPPTTTVQVPHYGGTAFALTRSPVETKIEIKANERPIVSQRKKQFEAAKPEITSPQTSANRYKTELQKIQSQGKFSSVAMRLANFERDSHLGDKAGYKFRRLSSADHYSSPEPSQSPHSLSNPNIAQYQESSAPIRIYVSQGNSNTPSSPIVEIVPVYEDNVSPMETSSQELHGTPLSQVHHDEVDGHYLSHDDLMDDSRGQKPVRKPSFLAAITSQQNEKYEDNSRDMTSIESSPLWTSSHVSMSNTSVSTMTSYSSVSSTVCMPPPSSGVALTSTPKDTKPPVKLRKKSEISPEDKAERLQRRTSYLMATANDRDTHKLSLDKSVSPSHADSEEFQTTPVKHQQSMRKLKNFFGEKTPRIVEAASEKRSSDPASPLQEVVREGTLYMKMDLTDGKKSSDRSWKPVWVELRGHCLYLFKDKKDSSATHPFSFEDQPVSIKSCLVDKAYDYTKKKNVFRLRTFNGSEYLFQADEQDTMMSWIDAIKEHNNPDSDDKGVMIAESIRMGIQHEQAQKQVASSTKTSPQPPQKTAKKLSVISLKPKLPQSPSTKRKKTDDKDTNKTKGFKYVIKSFRKGPFSSSSGGNAGETEVTGMFGVPLECCIPSPNNDFVPMIVDLCTKIVEARGLEVTGVYRVPGNTAAVNMMQEELNKGIDNMNVDHEKWCDVNVISSLLKAFFRKLPDSLVTSELYDDFIIANRLEDQQRRMLKLKQLLHKLPEHHFETFRHLAEHLYRIASNGHLNKMDARNLAMMFGPNLVRRGDNDMAILVKDMSDQCRIVETIIQHYDWFFGSWDQDSYVPIDEPLDVEGAPAIPSVSKMSCDEDDNTINPRDIVMSIVEAANKKLRHKDGKSMDDLDGSLTDGVFNERNIDQEILRHNRMKVHHVDTSRSSPNLSAMSRSSQEQIVKIRQNAESTADRRMAKSQEIIDTDFSNWDFEKERQSQNSFNKTAVSRHFSEDSLDRNDEFEISHSLSNSFSLSRDTIDSLRRIEEEARTLREKEEKRRRDHEKRKLEWQRVEQDIQRTQKEIELEDSHSVEDLLNVPTHMWHSSSEIFNRLASGKMDSDSLASDYSNTSSSDSRGVSSRLKYGNMSDYSSSTSPASAHDKHLKVKENVPGGKYFVIQSRKDLKPTLQKPLQGSVESVETLQSKRTNSLETMLEDSHEQKMQPLKTHKIVHKQKRDHRHRHANRDSSEHVRGSRGNLSRSNSMRRGSLDSLIDLYDKYDGSSDSEDGSDLLSDLTSTFDQKIRILVNPKYKLSGNATRLNKSDGSGSSDREITAQFKLPPQVPLSQCSKFGLCNSSDRLEREFRDPSLHRSPVSKSEAKVGIASRFERNPSNNNNNSVTHNNNTSSSYLSSSSHHIPMATPNVPTETRTSSVMVVIPSPITVLDSKPKSSSLSVSSSDSSFNSSLFKTGNSSAKSELPGKNFEKSELNFSKQGKEIPSKIIHIKSSSLDYDKSKSFNSVQSKDGTQRLRSPSPQPGRRKEKRTKRRRHTVGSTDDVEHFKALMTLQQTKDEPKLSAWEQLQPNVKDGNLSASSSMLSWLRNERLRGSSPDLSSVPNHPTPKFF